MLLAVGQRSEEAREISRWLAIGLLVPGCLRALSQVRHGLMSSPERIVLTV